VVYSILCSLLLDPPDLFVYLFVLFASSRAINYFALLAIFQPVACVCVWWHFPNCRAEYFIHRQHMHTCKCKTPPNIVNKSEQILHSNRNKMGDTERGGKMLAATATATARGKSPGIVRI